MKLVHSALVIVAAFLVPAPAFAHEGHGFEGTLHSLMHWLSDPYHIVLIGAALVAAVGIPFAVRRIGQRRSGKVRHLG